MDDRPLPPPASGGPNWAIILLTLILIVVVAAAVAIYSLVAQTLRPVQDLTTLPGQGVSELQTQVSRLTHPTPTIRPDPATIILQVKNLNRLETVAYTVEKVISAEENQGPFAWLVGDKLLFVAHGQVIAGIDMNRLQASDIKVLSNNRLDITLPAAEIFVVTLDNNQSYVYERETGILRGAGNIQLEAAARQAAEDEILDAALEDGVLNLAQTNAQNVLRQLFAELGYTNVTFTMATPVPTPPGTPVP